MKRLETHPEPLRGIAGRPEKFLQRDSFMGRTFRFNRTRTRNHNEIPALIRYSCLHNLVFF